VPKIFTFKLIVYKRRSRQKKRENYLLLIERNSFIFCFSLEKLTRIQNDRYTTLHQCQWSLQVYNENSCAEYKSQLIQNTNTKTQIPEKIEKPYKKKSKKKIVSLFVIGTVVLNVRCGRAFSLQISLPFHKIIMHTRMRELFFSF